MSSFQIMTVLVHSQLQGVRVHVRERQEVTRNPSWGSKCECGLRFLACLQGPKGREKPSWSICEMLGYKEKGVEKKKNNSEPRSGDIVTTGSCLHAYLQTRHDYNEVCLCCCRILQSTARKGSIRIDVRGEREASFIAPPLYAI